MNRFENRVALITGGGSGIGAATALRLAEEGAQVMIVGRNLEKLQKVAAESACGQRVNVSSLDVTQPDDVRRVVDGTVDELGGLDIVVNAAAINHYGSVTALSDAVWREAFAVTVDGAFYVSRASIPHLSARGGCIINVGSVAASRADRDHAAYVSAKGALVQLTNALALDHGSSVRTNAVHPGFTLGTEMTAPAADYPQIADAFIRASPRGRAARPEDIASCIAFLASDDAEYVNGAHLAVDGGLSASAGQPDFSDYVRDVS
ncbi:SDR family NAD(P)-dependent oxidoreductase [Streptomyces olivaceus]|uniref:SDR family NAD(P)-dependent oxidoreductase n=1 Tax=Streptomyces olivaceus TaxID=47716 RepID=UPI00405640B4